MPSSNVYYKIGIYNRLGRVGLAAFKRLAWQLLANRFVLLPDSKVVRIMELFRSAPLISVSVTVACLASTPAFSQGVARSDPLAVWRETSAGMSTNAALAFYRLRNSAGTPSSPVRLNGFRASQYEPPTAQRSGAGTGLQSYYQATATPPVKKPFSDLEPEPTAFEKYWPLLLVGRQDPKTGIIVWYLP